MADRYWVNDDADGLWSNTNNWSASSGGAGGAGVPNNGDTGIFDSGSDTACRMDVALTGDTNIHLKTGYASELDANADNLNHAIGDLDYPDGVIAATIDFGTGTWNVAGHFKHRTSGTPPSTVANIYLNGTAKDLYFKPFTSQAGNFYIVGSYTLYTACDASSLINVSGTLTLNARWGSTSITITATGTINGSSYLVVSASTLTIISGGSIACSSISARMNFTLDAPEIGCELSWNPYYNTNKQLRFLQNTKLTNLVIQRSGTCTGSTINMANNNSSLEITGDVAIVNTDEITWSKGTGTITLSGSSDQDIDFAGEAVEDLVIDKTAGNVVMTGNVQTDSFTGTSTGTGDFDPNGKTITVDGNCDWAAAFDFDSAADCMNSCTWTIGGNFTADGQTLNANSGWTWVLSVTGTAVASGTGAVAYCNAGGGTEIDASAGPWTDNGNNTNWNFGAAGALLTRLQSEGLFVGMPL